MIMAKIVAESWTESFRDLINFSLLNLRLAAATTKTLMAPIAAASVGVNKPE